MAMNRCVLWASVIGVICAVAVGGSSAFAQDDKNDKAEELPSWDRMIRPMFRSYCYRCHNDEKQKGNINLEEVENPRLIMEGRKTWLTVVNVLREKKMPPEDSSKPKDDERAKMLEFVTKTLDSLDCSKLNDPGKPIARRLNRNEYNNCVSDLFGLDLRPADDFPPDKTGYGFDNIGDVLTMSPVLVEQYYTAANGVLDEIVPEKGKRDASRDAAYERVYVAHPEPGMSWGKAARQIVERFATRAFRRPVEPQRVDRLMTLFDKAREKGLDFDHAVRPMLAAVLISPHFLFRIEQQQEGGEPYLVDDYDVAARLSFFLWSGPPDQTLYDLAAAGKLSKPDAVREQAKRMLADPRSVALAENFIGQMLQLRTLDDHQPNARSFPQFTEALRDAMTREVTMLAAEVIRNDRPITELLDADYTFLNQTLAEHYGIDGVTGSEMRRVRLKDRRRGGVLTSAAILTLTSDPQRTNIPRRGNYVAGVILGDPPPPPPPDVPPLEDSRLPGKTLTLRQMLEEHRRDPECASCHARIDPLGFSLQNFDAVGRWQDEREGHKIDASGELPGGRKFVGPVELKAILLERKDGIARTLAERMLIYAMGRGITWSDECAIRNAVLMLQHNEYRFSAMVEAIVISTPFRYRRNPDS